QTANSVDITSVLQDSAHTYTYTVTATGSGSSGPPSLVGAAPGAPALSMAFGPDSTSANTLIASWTATDNASSRYLNVNLVSGNTQTPVSTNILPGSMLTFTVPVSAIEGQLYSATVRGLTPGNVGPVSNAATVTIHILSSPTFGAITS